MAYVVGSVSVEVVPDFRNAQNAITAWFKAQPDSLKVPVRPDLDQPAIQRVTAQAEKVGEAVGRSISEGTNRTVSRALADRLLRQINKLTADIEKARRTAADATKALEIAETRLNEARKAGNKSASTMLSLENAVEKQRQRISDANRLAAESQAQLTAVRQQYAQETQALVEREAAAVAAANKKVLDAERKLNDQLRREADKRDADADRREMSRTAAQEREAAARQRSLKSEVAAELRIEQQAAAERQRAQDAIYAAEVRQREQAMRAELAASQRQAKALVKSYQDAFKEAERAKIQVEVDEQRAIAAGRNAGGLVVRSMRAEIQQNAGLIAAVVGGVLMAGAPVATAAAVTLFAGVGAAAAMQSQEVRSAFAGMWQDVKSQSVADAQSLVPTFERVAGAIDQSFQRIRPTLRETFQEISPQIEEFTVHALRAGEVALPGMARAARNADPVMRGFGLGLIEIGEGLSDFFDILANDGPVAGRVAQQFGEAVGTALPLLADLTVVGAEVATDVLPAFTGALRAVNGAVDLLGGSLPTLVTGFLAFKTATAFGSQLQHMSARLGHAAIQGGTFADAQRKGANALHRVSRVLPGVGTALGGLALAYSANENKITGWSDALLAGGTAAQKARAEMTEFDAGIQAASGGFRGFIADITGTGTALDILANNTDEAKKRADEYKASLDPLARAQLELQTASADLSRVMGDQESSASDVARAQAEYARASARVAAEQEALEMATHGATEAMKEQADQARSAVDAAFAYRESLNDLTDAQKSHKDAVAEFGKGSDEAKRAMLDLQIAMNDTVKSAGDLAESRLPAGLNDAQIAAERAKAEIAAMDELIEQGFTLPPAMRDYYNQLQDIAGQANDSAIQQQTLIQALKNVGVAAESIPGTKAIKVEALTEAAQARLEDLGFTVTRMPDGSFRIEAKTEKAQGAMENIAAALAGIDDTTATPTVDANPSPFISKDKAARARLEFLDRQKPTPVMDANPGPFNSKYGDGMGKIGTFGRQKPTPVMDANSGPFGSKYGTAMGNIGTFGRQSPSATLNARDNASGTIGRITGMLAAIPRYVESTIVTVNRTVNQTVQGSSIRAVAAEGGDVSNLPVRPAPVPMGPPQRFAVGGAAIGSGGTRDDRIYALLSNGEHVLDARDVAMMGGQAGVYAFREMLNSGRIGSFSPGRAIQDMLQAPGASQGAGSTVKGFENNGTIVFADQEDFFRQMRASERAALATVLNA